MLYCTPLAEINVLLFSIVMCCYSLSCSAVHFSGTPNQMLEEGNTTDMCFPVVRKNTILGRAVCGFPELFITALPGSVQLGWVLLTSGDIRRDEADGDEDGST